MTSNAPSLSLLRDLYARMLLVRVVDEYACGLYEHGYEDAIASCRGYEAAQVGTAVCIEVGKDFTLPSYRSLGVVLTIGMTPYEVFRTHLQHLRQQKADVHDGLPLVASLPPIQHWGYQKHNTVTGPAPMATQLLHAAGIAFACKLRKASVVTVAYCDDGVIAEADFLESIHFSALHQLPIIFICEHASSYALAPTALPPSCLCDIALPDGLAHHHMDGTDVVAVHAAMHTAIQHVRSGHGPLLLELSLARCVPPLSQQPPEGYDTQARSLHHRQELERGDPLARCQQQLRTRGAWDDEWARQLSIDTLAEVERAMHDAIRDTL